MLCATFRQLEILLAAAEEGGFTTAAKRLNISQAAISRQIQALERKLGAKLFERESGRTAMLTEHGRQLRAQAPGLMANMSAIAAQWQRPTPAAKRVRVASGDIIQGMIFQPRMSEFHKLHPEIQVELVEMPPAVESVERMSKLRIDLAYFTFPQHTTLPGGEVVATLEHGLFISPQHSLAGIWKAGNAETLPLLMYLSGSAAERHLCRMLRTAGIGNYQVAARAQRTETLIQLALEGVGACWTPTHLVEPHVQNGRLVDLDLRPERLCRYKFRRPASERNEHIDAVDGFLTALMIDSPTTACG